MLKLSIILFFSFLLVAVYASAEWDFYNDPQKGKEGFYGYEPVKKEEPEKEIKNEEGGKKEEPKKHNLPSLKDYTMKQLWGMHPDDFRPLLADFHKKAVMTNNPSDIKDYIAVLDLMRRRTLAFTNTYLYVLQQNPQFNIEKDYSAAQVGRGAMVRQQMKEVEDEVKNNKESFALLYFYSPTCEYCIEQNKILDLFSKKHGWDIKKINIETEPETAASFDIDITPSIILVYKNSKDPMRIASGVMELVELEMNLYRGTRLMKGEIKPEDFTMYNFEKGKGFDVKNPNPLSR